MLHAVCQVTSEVWYCPKVCRHAAGTGHAASREGTALELRTPMRLVDSVYEQLREAILAGDLEPGERLSIPNLAQKIGVSRSPIREAVQRLTQDGLAIEEPRRGAVVNEVSIADLVKLYEIREVLEGLAARLAAERANPELVAHLDTVLTAHEAAIAADDRPKRQQENIRFHRAIRQASDNPGLERWLDTIEGQVSLAMRRTGMIKGDVEQTIKEHRAIFEAIESSDPQAAEAAARAHISRVRDKLLLLS